MIVSGRNQLYLKVHPYIWEFYRGFYNSEVINVTEHPLLMLRIKSILQTRAEDHYRRKWSDFRIIVLNLPSYFRCGDKVTTIVHRNYLDDRRQYIISQELYHDFKNSFINYVLGYVKNGGLQSEAISNFCIFYNFEMNQVKMDSLKKIWDRSELKQKWNIERGVLNNVKKRSKNIDVVSLDLVQ